MLINLSNHPYEKWSSSQRKQALSLFGKIQNVGFPNIDPHWSYEEVKIQAQELFNEISNDKEGGQFQILLAGEQSFLIAFYQLCKEKNIPVFTSTSNRIIKELEDGSKNVIFEFKQFRKINHE